MTEHSEQGSAEVPADASGLGQDISSTVAKLGAGEKLAVLGAAGVLAVWLVFDLLIDEYPIGHLPFALALVAGAGAYLHHNRGSADWSVDYKTVILVTCGLTGVIGAWMLIEEVRGGILDDNAAEVIGAVLYWATSITSGVGAWQLSKR